MTIDRTAVEEGARLVAEHADALAELAERVEAGTSTSIGRTTLLAHARVLRDDLPLLAHELQRLWRVEEALEVAAREAAGGNLATYERLTSVLRPRQTPALTKEQRAQIAACPTPVYHETHRYCPSCPWTELVDADLDGTLVEGKG